MTTEHERNLLLSLRPTSIFIIRSCLGWLFDQKNLSNNYYSYRQNRKPLDILLETSSMLTKPELVAVKIFVPKNVVTFFNGNHHIVMSNTDYTHENSRTLSVTLEKSSFIESITQASMTDKIQFQPCETNQNDINRTLAIFDPLLETVLYAACPFLADFRVSIMPRRNSKVVSRTGRLRHITPKIYETPTAQAKTIQTTKPLHNENDTQTKLVEAFLHSQSLSVRRTVEFVEERVFSAVVKDFQVEILLPFKKTIIESIDKIQLKESQAILDELYRIYANGEKCLLEKWREFVVPAALERVKVKLYYYYYTHTFSQLFAVNGIENS